MSVFNRLAPYIQDYIYREKWEELREIQVAACEVIFNSQNNLLLSTGTASGKTEAAFLPTLTKIYEEPPSSVGILYISPLKSLINDQFFRLDYLLKEGNIPVCKWHGDSSQSSKNKLIKNPQGVLQITPESIEALLMNKQSICKNLFKDLRFIIIDEVHYFMNSARGIQLLCQLERIQKLTDIIPRRIGLSATLNNYSNAEQWLNSGTNAKCTTPQVAGKKRTLSIAMECFERQFEGIADTLAHGEIEHFNYIYKKTLNKKAIIFANTKSTVEFTIAHIKKIAEENQTKNVYRVHHGNVSTALREETEKEMKSSNEPIVTGATVTLELGVDIGFLDRIVQIGAPYTVSSFVQRLGRCGRRGQNAEMIFTFIEDKQALSPFFSEFNWEFIRGIAILQLYLEEKWVEPVSPPTMPFSLLYHQTMSHIASNGEISPPVLAKDILTMSPFKKISLEDYRNLLKHLINIEHLQKTESGGLIIGQKGEKLTSHYEFYSVFEAPVKYTVKNENKTIGTIQHIPKIGDTFALASNSWQCTSVDGKNKMIFAKKINGVSKIKWVNVNEYEFHSKLLKKMQEIILSNKEYAYLSSRCKEKLLNIRKSAEKSGFAKNLITQISTTKYVIFPWVGTKEMLALLYAIDFKGISCSNKGFYLEVEYRNGKDRLKKEIQNIIEENLDKFAFKYANEIQIPSKYNKYIPQELLRKQFIEEYIDLNGLKKYLVID